MSLLRLLPLAALATAIAFPIVSASARAETQDSSAIELDDRFFDAPESAAFGGE